jgi:charged multivesicular body protein 5
MFWRKKAPVVTQEEYQSRLGNRTELARGKLEALEKELLRHRQQMRTAPKGSAAYRTAEAQALRCLKHRKLLENQLGVYANQTFTMDQVTFAKENLTLARESEQQMLLSKKQLSKELKRTNVDRLDEAAYSLADALQETDEVQEVLGRNYHIDTEFDDVELLAELDSLESEFAQDQGVRAGKSSIPVYLQEREEPVEAPERSTSWNGESVWSPNADLGMRAPPVPREPIERPQHAADASLRRPSAPQPAEDEMASLRRSMAV